jgi:RecA-family ATPase
MSPLLKQFNQRTIALHHPESSKEDRQTIRDEMNEFFTQEIRKQHIYVLYGLGGAGKTQIALKFISDSSQ